MGKNNRDNREAKKKKFRQKKSPLAPSHIHQANDSRSQATDKIRSWAMEVAGNDKLRLDYLQDMGFQLVLGAAAERDIHFLEEEKPKAWEFLDKLLTIRYGNMIAAKKADEGGIWMDVDWWKEMDRIIALIEKRKVAWHLSLNSEQFSCHHRPPQEQKAQLAPGL